MPEVPPKEVVAPTRDDPFLAASSHGIGGPFGRHAWAHRFWTPVRVVLVLVTLAGMLWLVRSAPCTEGGGWFGGDPFSDLCYSDLPLRYVDEGHAELTVPYSDTQGRYPQTTATAPVAAAGWLASVLTHRLSGSPDVDARGDLPVSQLSVSPALQQEAVTYFHVCVLLLFGCVLLTAGLIVAGSGRRPWDAAAFASAPALLLAGTIGWDLLAVVLSVAGWWAWSRGRPVAAGILTGLGVATAVWPLALLVAVVVTGTRGARRADVGVTALSAAVVWTLVQLPALRLGLGGWWRTVDPRLGEPPGYGSLWGLAADAGHTVDPVLMAGLVVVAAGVAVGGVTAAAWRAQGARVAQVAFLVLVGWLVVWPVYSPQQVLWLLPFAVLARPRWRELLVWQAGEACYFVAVWMHLSGATAHAGSVDRAYAAAIVVRIAAEIYLAGVVLRDLREPWADPVTGSDRIGRAVGTRPGG